MSGLPHRRCLERLRSQERVERADELVWIDQYCAAHPLDNLGVAAALVQALKAS